ncbi:hypothetical protein AAMO2058_000990500 [Amorphochlora amoebiformis]
MLCLSGVAMIWMGEIGGRGEEIRSIRGEKRGKRNVGNRKLKGTFYEILGVSREATRGEIRAAFKRLSLKTHPDKNPLYPEFKLLYEEILRAYRILIDPCLRRVYDMYGDNGLENSSQVIFRTEDNKPVGKTTYAEVKWSDHEGNPINKTVGRIDYTDMQEYIHVHSISLDQGAIAGIPSMRGVELGLMRYILNKYHGRWTHQVFSPSGYSQYAHEAVVRSWRQCCQWASLNGLELRVYIPSPSNPFTTETVEVNLSHHSRHRDIPPLPFSTIAFRKPQWSKLEPRTVSPPCSDYENLQGGLKGRDEHRPVAPASPIIAFLGVSDMNPDTYT